MRKIIAVIAGALVLGARAEAADKPAMAPPASWVKPVTMPLPPAATGEAPVRILLQDQQADLEPGRQTVYSQTVVRIEKAQGLSAGNITFAWNPDIDAPTVHKLQVRRGDKVIDVLANQSFTIVRRESNLENAALDGVLTATIQPEGLQVGDIVDFAMSVTRSDPAVGKHAEAVLGGWNGVPISHGHLRVQWPSVMPMRLRTTPGLAMPTPVRQGAMTSIELSLDDVQPLQPPKGAPLRYSISRMWEITDFRDWADLARLMAPLYAKAATLPQSGALQGEIAKIAAQSADPKARARAALTLVQDRIRYVFLGMNDGGLVPADAETTWSRRFGDCKGKTALLLALLHGLGIDAEPAIVSAGSGDGMDQRLPIISLFNHVLVRVTIAGRVYWLDGTRMGDVDLDQIRTPNLHWGLPLVPDAALAPMVPPPPERPLSTTRVRIDASAGLTAPAPFHVEAVWRDDEALSMSLGFARQTAEVRDSGLRDYWRKQYNFVDIKTVTNTYDPVHREETLVMDGTAHMDWTDGWYETDGLDVGYKADFSRDPGIGQDAPFAVAYPYDERDEETILLPKAGNFKVDHPEDVDLTLAGIAYHRHVAITGDRFTGEVTARSITPEFPAADAPVAQKGLRDLANKTVHLHPGADYMPTAREADAALLDKPTDADGYLKRGTLLLANAQAEAAIADFTSALKLDPRNEPAFAMRGMARAMNGDDALATIDLDAAAVLKPDDTLIDQGRAMLAARRGGVKTVADALSKLIASSPQDDYALSQRARTYRAAGDFDHALADAAAVLSRQPGDIGMLELRADINCDLGKRDLAAADAAALSAGNPASDFAQVTAGAIYARAGDRAAAMAAFDKAVTIAPSAFVYVNRSRSRPWRDFADRQADLDAAIKIDEGASNLVAPMAETAYRQDPYSSMTMLAEAQLQDDRKDYTGAVATLTTLLAAAPGDFDAMLARAIDRARLGNATGAKADMATLDAARNNPRAHAKICFSLGEAGVMLDVALADCDAATTKAPEDLAFAAQRAFVLLRLGRAAEAITAYNQLLTKRPSWASALYGRALANEGVGKVAAAKIDREAALKIDPEIVASFDRIGMPQASSVAHSAR
jgi:tetratricopeptide (TPR) repeat protein